MSDLAPVFVPSQENLMPCNSCQGNCSARGKMESACLCVLSVTEQLPWVIGAPHKPQCISVVLHPQLRLRAAQGKEHSLQV